jgi:long-chain fatty acid transport protein
MISGRAVGSAWRAGAFLLAFGCSVAEVQAGGFAVREQSAVGQGMSFAGAGTPGMGLSAMFWNPAAVTQAQGLWVEKHLSIVFPDSEITAGPGTSATLLALGSSSDNIGVIGFVPASYLAYQVNPNLYLGLAVNAPFGLGTKADTWAGSPYAIEAKALSIDINAIVGWKVNDQLSVAAGPRVMYFRGEFSRYSPAALPALVSADLKNLDDFGFGFTAGLTYTPTPMTEIALGYRSRTKLELHGDEVVGGTNLSGVVGNATLPDQATLGVRQRFGDKHTLLASVEWTNWSVLQTVPFAAAVPTTLTFNYRDGWFFALGGEYEWTPKTTLRAGIGYEISPVRDVFRDTSIPDDNRWWFSTGLTHKWNEKWTFDLGYSFVYVGHSPINIVPGHPDYVGLPLIATSDSRFHIVSAAIRYKFGEQHPAPAKIVK